MNKHQIDKKREAALAELWTTYTPKFSGKLQEILKRGYVTSNITTTENTILTIGLTFSFRKNAENGNSSFVFDEAKYHDRYYKTIWEVLPHDTTLNYEHTTLFYMRGNWKTEIELFWESKYGIEFLVKQLLITKEYIEAIQPKLMIVFSRRAANFFGKNYKKRKDTNTWLGYDFAHNNDLNLDTIIGLLNSEELICRTTNLMGQKIYFSRYLGGQGFDGEQKEKIIADLQRIFKVLF